MEQLLASPTDVMKLNFLVEDIPWEHGQQLFSLWQSRRLGRRWPSRSEISPMDMKPYLQDVMLIDVQRDPTDFVVRLAGTGYRRFMPYDPTGTRIIDLPNGEDVFARFERLLALGQPYMGLGLPLMWASVDFKRVNGLVLPLGDGVNVNTLMLLVEYV